MVVEPISNPILSTVGPAGTALPGAVVAAGAADADLDDSVTGKGAVILHLDAWLRRPLKGRRRCEPDHRIDADHWPQRC